MKIAEEQFDFVTHLPLGSRTRDQTEQKLNDFDYADDIALLEHAINTEQEQLEQTSQAANEVDQNKIHDNRRLPLILEASVLSKFLI